jgi:DNA-directed RNA polymerase subunit alpha
MARIPFQKPKTIEWEINTDRYGRLVAEPFEKGYALTVGHSLRRTLLSIISGAAVVWARMPGVRPEDIKRERDRENGGKDELVAIPGVEEPAQDVILNLKKLAINVPSGEPTTTRLEATGPRR